MANSAVLNEKFNPEPLRNVLEEYEGEKGVLIPLLQRTQEIYGYVPSEAMEMISEFTGIPVSQIYGVVTFYAQFRLTPVGKHLIKVCHGTACHVSGAEKVTDALVKNLHIEPGETTEDGLFTMEIVACLGCCSLAPVMMIDDETYGRIEKKKVRKILRQYKTN